MKPRSLIMPTIFCLYLAAVALLCFLHWDNVPDITGTWMGLPKDKIVHACMFIPFIPLAYLSFRSRTGSAGKNLLIATVLLMLGIGTAYMTEIIQGTLKYRSYETADFLADCAGLGFGYACITIVLLVIMIKRMLT